MMIGNIQAFYRINLFQQSEFINQIFQLKDWQVKIIINFHMIEEDIYKTFQLQLDNEGFVKSFDLQTATQQELSQFYHKYGIIIFNDVLNQKQIELTINDLWNSTTTYYKENFNKKIDRKDRKSWGQLRGFQKAFGFVGDSILEQPQIWLNRKNPKVYKAFKKAYQAYGGKELSQPLIANFDRGSMMLPGKINPEWQTSDIYHFDIDPWYWTGQTHNRHTKYDYDPDRISLLLGQGNYEPFVGYTKFAGVLALSDTNQNSGGFSCACGFQNYIKKWCEKKKLYTHIEEDQNLVQNFRKIFMRKGSLLIFTRQLPHNIYQNKSENFRYAQYLRMSPLSSLCLTPELVQNRKKLIKSILPKNIDFSDALSQQIFMLDGEGKVDLKEDSEVKQQNEKKNNVESKEKENIEGKKQNCMIF